MPSKGSTVATESFRAGYNCSQSTLAGLLAGCGKRYASRMDLAVGFQAGIAQTGKMCGCMSGIIMALGLIIPREELGLVAWKQKVSDVSREIMSLFIKEYGSLDCSDIAGCDMSIEVNRKRFLIEQRGRQMICEPIVGGSVDMAICFLNRSKNDNVRNQKR